MKFLDDQLHELETQLKMTDKSKEELRSRILLHTSNTKRRHVKSFIWITVACMLVLFTSPFYSTTAASIVARILPISIIPTFSDGQYNPDLTNQLYNLVEMEGYTANFVGVTPSPYTIEVSLILKDSTLKQATDDLDSKIRDYLYENGYDEFNLKISEAAEVPQDDRRNELSSLYDKVSEIVKDVFTKYGYAREADYELAGVKETWFSNIVTIDMPDHIQESNKIIVDIEKEIKSLDLNIKDIEVNLFNLEHRQQDNRWGYVASDIYDAMAGKSMYQVTGMSYKIKNGDAYVSIKTDLEKPLSEEVNQEIKTAIRVYLDLPETKKQIKDDHFTIQLLLKNKKPFIEITD
ncbi:DUF4030 domain-containing protein [Sporosarcina sp. FSL W7-1349]|uniref:DUF4030 domain-containing protein n=1 Tax=Sporosarcina sp. FSL W7-1349 TaxID=2921561 RepID=UPI0030F8D6EE